MPTFVMSTHVKAPLEQVFAVFTDLEKAADRIPAITKMKMLTKSPFGDGTRWRETRLMFKKEATEEMWVTGFNPPNSYTVRAESHGSIYETLFEFTPEGDGTKVQWTFNCTYQSIGAKIMGPIFSVLMKGMMKKCMQEDRDALRDVCEGKMQD